MKKSLVILSLFGVFALQSCTTSKQNKTTHPNINGNWELSFIYEDSEADINKDFPQKLPVLNFETKTQSVSGNDGCNQLFGSFSTNQNEISFSQLGVTNMFCEGVKDFAYRQTLNTAKNFLIEDNQLTFYNENGDVILKYVNIK